MWLEAIMTYCVGVLLNDGLVMASDSRTNAGVDNFATFCKLTVFERVGDRVIVLASSGSLAGTQAVVSVLRQRTESEFHALFDSAGFRITQILPTQSHFKLVQNFVGYTHI